MFAWDIGLWLNRFITINFSIFGIGDERVAQLTAEFLRRAKQFLATRGAQSAHIFVREIAGQSGTHVHILLHIPPHLQNDFNRLQKGWLRQVTGLPYRSKALKSKRIGRSARGAEHSVHHYHENLHRVLNYLAKGVSEVDARALGLRRNDRMVPIIGKRCGISQNIGATARAKDRFSVTSFLDKKLNAGGVQSQKAIQPLVKASELPSIVGTRVDDTGSRIPAPFGVMDMHPQPKNQVAPSRVILAQLLSTQPPPRRSLYNNYITPKNARQAFKQLHRSQDRLTIRSTVFISRSSSQGRMDAKSCRESGT